MSLSLAVLTPGPDADAYQERTETAFAKLQALFAHAGVSAFPWPWDKPLEGRAHAASPLLAWGYHRHAEAWRRRLQATTTPMINPKDVLQWNTNKTYLLTLAEQGLPVIPTLVRETLQTEDLDAIFCALRTDVLVIKPTVAAGGHSARRLRRGDIIEPLSGSLLIQPFLEAVEDSGETSVFSFGGILGHAVRKRPAAGEFRVQPRFGGTMTTCPLEPDMAETARRAFAHAPAGTIYARIDLVRDDAGQPRLMELEAIEPDLYLEHAPDGGVLFARAVAAAMRRLIG